MPIPAGSPARSGAPGLDGFGTALRIVAVSALALSIV